LWNILKRSQLDGRKFRRQYGVSRYVLDFYCPAERLGIELDGKTHYGTDAERYDEERRMFVEHFGIKIIRFQNKFVFDELEWVLASIRANFGWQHVAMITTPSAEAAATPPKTGGELF